MTLDNGADHHGQRGVVTSIPQQDALFYVRVNGWEDRDTRDTQGGYVDTFARGDQVLEIAWELADMEPDSGPVDSTATPYAYLRSPIVVGGDHYAVASAADIDKLLGPPRITARRGRCARGYGCPRRQAQ